MRRLWLVLTIVAVLSADELPQHVIQLAKLRRMMRQSLDTLPDFTCMSVTQRYRQNPRDPDMRRLDQVRLEVAYVGGRELFAWPGETEFRSQAPAEMIGAGMFASGDFISHARAAFVGNYDVTKFGGPVNMPGHKLLRWDFTIAPMFAGWTVGFARVTANAGVKGSYWVDPDSLDLYMLEITTDGLPAGFPMKEVRTVITYAKTRIGSREVLLPDRSVTTATEAGGGISENHTEFSHCRQYTAQSAIHFDHDPDAPVRVDTAPPPKPAKEIAIPANLRVTASLTTPIESASATVGQRIEAVVSADVSDGKKVVIPKGAVLSGRLRRVQPNTGPPPNFIIALEFTDVNFEGAHARFFASMVQLHKRTIMSGGTYRIAEVPGVGTFVYEGESFRLEPGLESTWTTLDIRSRN